MNVYKRIQDLCDEHHCKVADVAKNSGLSLHVIYDWKKNSSEPTLAAIEKICQYFNITLNDFFYCDEFTEDQITFLKGYNKLSDSQIKMIEDTIKTFLENSK